MLYLWTELLPNAALMWLEKYLKVDHRPINPKPADPNISVGWDTYVCGEPASVLMLVYPMQSVVSFSVVFLTIDPSKNIDAVGKFLIDFNANFLRGCYLVVDGDKLVFRSSTTMHTLCTKKMISWISLHWLDTLSTINFSIVSVKDICGRKSVQVETKKDDILRWN